MNSESQYNYLCAHFMSFVASHIIIILRLILFWFILKEVRRWLKEGLFI